MKEGGSTNKNKFSLVIDVPEFLEELGVAKDATEVVNVVGD